MTSGKPPADAEDWAVLARRGALSGQARAEFERALEGSVTLRVAHRVGRDFDDIREVRTGDDEIVLRASTAALAGPRAGKRLRGRTFAVAAAALAVAASAAGASLWIEAARVERLHPPRATDSPRSPSPKTQDTTTPRRSAPIEVRAPETVAATPDPFAGLPRPATTRTPAVIAEAQPPRTATSLFEQASAARRAGELERARSLFAELQRAFPRTNEARVSRVSLGKLLLGAGKPREAEQQFLAYLATPGDLTEEALVGRAESLARLGERAAERSVWQGLLESRPSSVYAARARERLRELVPLDSDATRAH